MGIDSVFSSRLESLKSAFGANTAAKQQPTEQKVVSALAVRDSVSFSRKNVQAGTPDERKYINSLLTSKFNTSFHKIDSNNDGFITKNELVVKMQDQNVKNEEASFIGTFLKYHSKIKKLSNDEWGPERKGVTKNDMLAYDKLDEKSQKELKSDTQNSYYSGVYKIGIAKRNINTDGSFKIPVKAEDVNYKDLQQGRNGNCYFLAALASMAKHHPQKIVDMIEDNKDGSYTVKFPKKDIVISAPTHSEMGLYAEGGSWVPIIEKAYAVYRNNNLPFALKDPHIISGQGTYIIGRSIKELTGSDTDTDLLLLTGKDSTREKMAAAFDTKKLVVASINKEVFSKNDLELPDAHVYSVIDFDKQSDTVTIRNPWGSGEAAKDGNTLDGVDDGIFKLTVPEFHEYFDMVSYEK